MNHYTRAVVKQLNGRSKVSLDFDGVLDTPKGKALAKRLITQGFQLYIISARNERLGKSVEKVAEEVGIAKDRIYLTGSNSAKVDKIKSLGIERHYDNNMDVVNAVKKEGIEATLVNY